MSIILQLWYLYMLSRDSHLFNGAHTHSLVLLTLGSLWCSHGLSLGELLIRILVVGLVHTCLGSRDCYCSVMAFGFQQADSGLLFSACEWHQGWNLHLKGGCFSQYAIPKPPPSHSPSLWFIKLLCKLFLVLTYSMHYDIAYVAPLLEELRV